MLVVLVGLFVLGDIEGRDEVLRVVGVWIYVCLVLWFIGIGRRFIW